MSNVKDVVRRASMFTMNGLVDPRMIVTPSVELKTEGAAAKEHRAFDVSLLRQVIQFLTGRGLRSKGA